MSTRTEPNYWMRQANEARATQTRARRDLLLEEISWAATLIIWWAAWLAVCVWKTIPGGIAALPMFLILAGMGTTIAITAWVKTR